MTFNFKRDFFYEEGFPFNLGGNSGVQNLVSGNVNKDGNPQNFLFSINESGEIYAIGSKGVGLFEDSTHLIKNVTENLSETQVQPLALMDTNNVKDGVYDLIVALSNNTLYGIDITAPDADSLDFETNDQITAAISSPIVIDSSNHIHFVDSYFIKTFGFNGTILVQDIPINNELLTDLILDINGNPYNPRENYNFLARDNTGEFIGALNENGETTFSIFNPADEISANYFVADSIVGQFSLGDIDGNGTSEIIFNTHEELNAFNKNGISIINFPVLPKLSAKEKLIGTPMLIELSANDLIMIVTTNKGQIFAYNKHGNLLNGFPIAAGGQFSHQAIPMQLDADSPIELVAISNSGIVSAWEIPGTGTASKLIWSNTNLNASNNSFFKEPYAIQNLGNQLLNTSRFFNYPNPNIGNSTKIRYYLNDPAEVTIRIFDTAGFKVDEFKGPGLADTDNEIEWNVKNVASGVYICQLEAKSATKKERELIKILVVH